MVDIDKIKRQLSAIGKLPLDVQWMYSSIRHCERNMGFEEDCPEIQAGNTFTPDRQCGGEIAEILNSLPALLDELEALRAASIQKDQPQ